MARMSIDDRFLRDPRVQRMANALGWNKYEARGRLLEVYAIVYDMVQAGRGPEPIVSASDIDTAADFPGLAERMIEFDLAVRVRSGLRIRGSKEHTTYLMSRRESGRAGGIKSGESRRNKSKQETKVTFAKNEGRGNPSAPDPDQASASPPDPVPDQDLSEKNSARASRGSSLFDSPDLPKPRARRSKPSEPTPDERASAMVVLEKLGGRNGIRYSGASEHVRLITARLRDGASEMDLRAVVGYCAESLGWQGNADMEKYLRPETLFGPKTIAKYLDPARTWAGDRITNSSKGAS